MIEVSLGSASDATPGHVQSGLPRRSRNPKLRPTVQGGAPTLARNVVRMSSESVPENTQGIVQTDLPPRVSTLTRTVQGGAPTPSNKCKWQPVGVKSGSDADGEDEQYSAECDEGRRVPKLKRERQGTYHQRHHLPQ